MSARVAARLHGSMVGEAPASGVRLSPAVMLDMTVGCYEQGLINYAAFRKCLGASPAICTVTVPVKTVSELNRHEHWRIRAKRAKTQHAAVGIMLIADGFVRKFRESPTQGRVLISSTRLGALHVPLHIHLTRLSARKLDTDNLAGALKHCRDAVAKFLGVDDGREDLVSWSVGQEQQKGYAVRCEFYRRSAT